MQLLEGTQESEPKYDLWPYKRRNTGGSITKNYRCVDLTTMHICTKFERNRSRNVACRAHTRFPPIYDLWPYKRRNTGGSITKNNKPVDFTKIHLHTKFERNPSRKAAVRAHTRMWRGGRGRGGGVTLLNPKYPPAVPAGGYNYSGKGWGNVILPDVCVCLSAVSMSACIMWVVCVCVWGGGGGSRGRRGRDVSFLPCACVIAGHTT